ncbi:MAG: 50S ribosomal protein L23 [Rhodothermales bacterium]|nr:50S ribosomal protein L23 [Rhodothermales bacterium]
MAQEILIQPLVTEKLSAQMEEGHYAFVVRKDANKVQIKKAVQARYPDIKIKEVRTMIVRGKRRRQQTRAGVVEGRVAAFKKAIVTLQPDSAQIDFFEEI